ncbi:MAG: aldo/keto reductase, partial [Armatimonadota bacterium]|nr:aldo/keto reductase [Armatimonadota bacterium]
ATGVRVSFLGVGTGVHGWMRQSDQTRMGRDAFTALVRHAYDRGITFFDTADLYGTHPFLKDALKGIPRERVVLQTKIWFGRGGLPERVTDARAAVERFLQELGTDYLDSVLLHCTTAGSWPSDLAAMRDALSALKEKGVIRSHGVSCHSRAALEAAAALPWVDVQLARVNHNGAKMDGPPDAIAQLLRGMRSAGKGVVGMKLFGEGTFRTPEERAASLRFVVEQRCVDAVVIGFDSPRQIDETLKQIENVARNA